jgi:hypothetical protein
VDATVSTTVCRRQWSLLKHYMHDRRIEDKSQTEIQTLLLTSPGRQFDAILCLYRLLLVLMLSTELCRASVGLRS